MRALTPSLLLFLAASPCRGNDQDLRRRVEQLEGQLANLEQLEGQLANLEALVREVVEKDVVGPYGMIRRCPIPRVDHGTVTCNKDDEAPNKDYRYPGTFCSAECQAGYFTTPGVTCSDDGNSWSGELRCDTLKELVVVSGGTETDLSVEIINFHANSTGCDIKIPNLATNSNNEVRLMHNMFLNPTDDAGRPQLELWVCNGLSQSDTAECDYWKPGNSNWQHHSYTNTGSVADSWQVIASQSEPWRQQEQSKGGRYGAESFSWNGYNYVVGGMINKGNNHRPSKSIRYYKEDGYQRSSWRDASRNWHMRGERSLFCLAQLNMSTPSFVAIGGHSWGGIEKSATTLWHVIRNNVRHKIYRTIADMTTARNGHACVGIGGDKEQILVSGGSDKPHREGKKALKTSEIYNYDTNQWEVVGDMNQARFGHALVNIGGRIIALGGKEWNPDKALRNAEEFDLTTKTWSSLGDVMKIPRANFGYVKVPWSLIPGCTVY